MLPKLSSVSTISTSVSTETLPIALFIINGESNSGGYALNSQAPSNEIGVRSEVKILNNTTLTFENLNIGVNNLIDHSGLSNGVTHGFELALANAVRDGYLKFSEVYLVKTGHGGSQISQWLEGGEFWNKFVERINASKTILNSQYKVPQTFVIYSQGINDAIASVNATTWKNATTDHLLKIRKKLGYVPILMTKFMSPYSSYNTQIDNIATSSSFNLAISATSASLRDANHWDYNGFITIFDRMIPQINYIKNNYSLLQNNATFDYLINNSGSFITASQSTGSQSSGSGASNVTGSVTWGSFVNSLQSGSFLNMNGSIPAGATSTQAINAQQPFSILVDYLSPFESTDATVVYLDDVL